MIIGSINDIGKYSSLSKNFKTAINYIQSLLTLNQGKHTIDGEEVYLIRDSYDTKPIEECFFESHIKYADIQIVLSGEEGFGYKDAKSEGIVVTEDYSEDKDVKKYSAKPELIYKLKKDRFAIVFPEDLHMVKIDSGMCQEKCKSEKVVIKVKL